MGRTWWQGGDTDGCSGPGGSGRRLFPQRVAVAPQDGRRDGYWIAVDGLRKAETWATVSSLLQ